MSLIQEHLSFNHYRDGTSFEFQREITRPSGDLDDILYWCKSELGSDWRWQLIDVSTDRRPGTYKFYFDSERDCVAFMLHWA